MFWSGRIKEPEISRAFQCGRTKDLLPLLNDVQASGLTAMELPTRLRGIEKIH